MGFVAVGAFGVIASFLASFHRAARAGGHAGTDAGDVVVRRGMAGAGARPRGARGQSRPGAGNVRPFRRCVARPCAFERFARDRRAGGGGAKRFHRDVLPHSIA